MTNAELIATIRNEIERRITDNTFGAKLELIDILAWLSTLESEKPMNQEGLKEEIESYWKENGLMSHAEYDRLAKCANHFAQWGAEHLADARKTSPNDLEEAADEYEKRHTYQRYDGGGFTSECDATLAEAVIFGAKWQKEQDEKELSEKIAAAYQLGLADKEKQMLKEAMEYEVGMHGEPIKITFDKYVQRARGIFPGEKIKIIIVKED